MVAVKLDDGNGRIKQILNHIGLRFDEKIYEYVRLYLSVTDKEKRWIGFLNFYLKCLRQIISGSQIPMCVTLLLACVREEKFLADIGIGDLKKFLEAVGLATMDPQWLNDLYWAFRHLTSFDYFKVNLVVLNKRFSTSQ